MPAVEGEGDSGAAGAQPQDVEWQVHADDGVCMAQPNGEGGVGRDAAEGFFSGWFDLFDGRGRGGRARVLGPPASENPY